MKSPEGSGGYQDHGTGLTGPPNMVTLTCQQSTTSFTFLKEVPLRFTRQEWIPQWAAGWLLLGQEQEEEGARTSTKWMKMILSGAFCQEEKCCEWTRSQCQWSATNYWNLERSADWINNNERMTMCRTCVEPLFTWKLSWTHKPTELSSLELLSQGRKWPIFDCVHCEARYIIIVKL